MLNNRTVMITGASAGIGEACARAFAGAGGRLILAARRVDRLEKLAAELREAHGTDSHLLELDVRDREAVNAAVAGLPDQWRDIDILINNAGLSRGLDKLHESRNHLDWEEMIDTNVKGLLWVSRAVIPGMVERDAGHVINLGSIAGRQVYPSGNVYCATKYAERALTEGMRIDLSGTRVRVTTIDPGMVETEFSEVRFRGDTERAGGVYGNFPPLAAGDIADAALWAASRPGHVNISEILIMPTDQQSAYVSHKRGR